MRQITITVNAVSEAQLKSTQGGRAYVEFRAVNHEYNVSKKDTDTFWVRVLSFVPQHASFAQHIKKGSSLIISGEYTNSTYVRKDGSVEIDNTLIANYISFAGAAQTSNTEHSNAEHSDTKQTVDNNKEQKAEIRNPAVNTPQSVVETTPSATVATDEDDDLPF